VSPSFNSDVQDVGKSPQIGTRQQMGTDHQRNCRTQQGTVKIRDLVANGRLKRSRPTGFIERNR
jgi:hypothetical protein